MDFFNNDPFDDILKEFFGEKPRRKSYGDVVSGESEERIIDYIEEDDKVYFVFELPGYSKEDIEVYVRGKELFVKANKKNFEESVQDYLTTKLRSGINFNKAIPQGVKSKKFNQTFKNGILEVSFNKK